MAISEFGLIDRFFKGKTSQLESVDLGIGDDCALLRVPANRLVAVTTDTMVKGVHFDDSLAPDALGHKLAAVNLSDLAAMGAEPAWVSLALTLPDVDENWLEGFSQGLMEQLNYYDVQLVGGDVTRGPLTLSITAHGLVQDGKALTRSGAKPGDWIYVSGTLGDAAVALCPELHKHHDDDALHAVTKRLHRPTPRLLLGQNLISLASSCIDISDGLAADLGHILNASGCGATVDVGKLPVSDAAIALMGGKRAARKLAFNGGDDYELCFTVSEESKGALDMALNSCGVSYTCVGQLNGDKGNLTTLYKSQPIELAAKGYQHF